MNIQKNLICHFVRSQDEVSFRFEDSLMSSTDSCLAHDSTLSYTQILWSLCREVLLTYRCQQHR
jgi:hypothetical protein